tara:strand:- start:230 stop:430 length:201 start_codon:yes stop_codon:yes gene_type:complete
MKVGDLVEFSYDIEKDGVESIGIFAEHGTQGKHKVLFMGRSYWVPHKYIKSIAMSRKPDVNEEPLN